jgi:hypothetical protein
VVLSPIKGKTFFRARYEQLNLKAAEDIEDQNEPINGQASERRWGMRPNCECTTTRSGHALDGPVLKE